MKGIGGDVVHVAKGDMKLGGLGALEYESTSADLSSAAGLEEVESESSRNLVSRDWGPKDKQSKESKAAKKAKSKKAVE